MNTMTNGTPCDFNARCVMCGAFLNTAGQCVNCRHAAGIDTTTINPLSPQQQATREAWRYHFAGQAMAAILSTYHDSSRDMDSEPTEGRIETLCGFAKDYAIDTNGVTGEHDGANESARCARICADALLAELERTAKP